MIPTGTWHYGLIAQWWAEFNLPEEEEIEFYRSAIERFGQPALDLGCGAGRILAPLLRQSLEVDGCDISRDMIGRCRELADTEGLTTALYVQAMHELDVDRTYRTIYMCGAFGIGGNRRNDLEALHRCRQHLAPGGAIVFNFDAPYVDTRRWPLWQPGGGESLPAPWPAHGSRKRCANGDEIELRARTFELDPIEQRQTLEMRAILWRDGLAIEEETYKLHENLYFWHEVELMLQMVGFEQIVVEAAYKNRPPTREDEVIVATALRPV